MRFCFTCGSYSAPMGGLPLCATCRRIFETMFKVELPADTASYDELAKWQTQVVCMLEAGKIAFDHQKQNPPECYFCNRRVADDGSDDHEDECPFHPLDEGP